MKKLTEYLALGLMFLGVLMISGADAHSNWDLFWSQILIGTGTALVGGILVYPYLREHDDE